MGWQRAWLCAGVFALALGCGSGDAASDEGGATSTSGGEDPTDGGRRRAVVDDLCDHGGNADHTCRRGLYCCYGPPDDPGDHGSCMDECPEH